MARRRVLGALVIVTTYAAILVPVSIGVSLADQGTTGPMTVGDAYIVFGLLGCWLPLVAYAGCELAWRHLPGRSGRGAQSAPGELKRG